VTAAGAPSRDRPGDRGGWWRESVAVMGTVVSFALRPGPGGEPEAARAVAAAGELLREVDERFSTWRPQSPLSRFRRGASDLDELPDEVAGELAAVLELCLAARGLSGGWFDPWVLPGGVDPTGLVKGWAVERALGPLVAAGVRAAVVNAGGDAVVLGPTSGEGRAWAGLGPGWGPRGRPGVRFGVAHPFRPGALACVARVRRAIATSGSSARGAHFVDPRTGQRTRGAVAQATVVGPSLALADALATGLVVGGEPALAPLGALPGYEAYLVGFDGTELATQGFPFEPLSSARVS
jgi:thiamine biosynthesis lipoprotein